MGGEPPDGVAERARRRQLALGGAGPGPVNADRIEPLVHVGRRAEVVVRAFGIRPDRGHETDGDGLVRKHPALGTGAAAEGYHG